MTTRIIHTCRIKYDKSYWDDRLLYASSHKPEDADNMLSDMYRCFKMDYRKFFKMDTLSKAGFIAAEFLLRDFDREQAKEDMGIILFNKSGSLLTDEAYQQTIQHQDNYFPSPAVFVYTLPNIVAGEIAIRNKIYGETAFFILPEYDRYLIEIMVWKTFCHSDLRYLLAGWVEACKGVLDVRMMLYEAVEDEQTSWYHTNIIYKTFKNILRKWTN